MSSRRAIVVGHRGQDGQLLTRLLVERGYAVIGLGRDGAEGIGQATFIQSCDLRDRHAVTSLVEDVGPDEIYYLAAHHTSSQTDESLDVDDYRTGFDVNVGGLVHFLDAISRRHRSARLFYASSSLIFGNRPPQQPQNESTPCAPEEPYAYYKALAGDACRRYRRSRGVFASVGILYNHESPLRRADFLSARIARGAVAASRGVTIPLTIGDPDAAVDWGYTPDFVDAFTRILALDSPDDFVVATGQAHTVREFLAAAFGQVGLDWQRHVTIEPNFIARRRSGRVGDASKLHRLTGWQPSISFHEMVSRLVEQAARDMACTA